MALEKRNKEIVDMLLSVEGLELDIDHLKSKNMFSKAVTACQKFVSEKMGNDRMC